MHHIHRHGDTFITIQIREREHTALNKKQITMNLTLGKVHCTQKETTPHHVKQRKHGMLQLTNQQRAHFTANQIALCQCFNQSIQRNKLPNPNLANSQQSNRNRPTSNIQRNVAKKQSNQPLPNQPIRCSVRSHQPVANSVTSQSNSAPCQCECQATASNKHHSHLKSIVNNSHKAEIRAQIARSQ